MLPSFTKLPKFSSSSSLIAQLKLLSPAVYLQSSALLLPCPFFWKNCQHFNSEVVLYIKSEASSYCPVAVILQGNQTKYNFCTFKNGQNFLVKLYFRQLLSCRCDLRKARSNIVILYYISCILFLFQLGCCSFFLRSYFIYVNIW